MTEPDQGFIRSLHNIADDVPGRVNLAVQVAWVTTGRISALVSGPTGQHWSADVLAGLVASVHVLSDLRVLDGTPEAIPTN